MQFVVAFRMAQLLATQSRACGLSRAMRHKHLPIDSQYSLAQGTRDDMPFDVMQPSECGVSRKRFAGRKIMFGSGVRHMLKRCVISLLFVS